MTEATRSGVGLWRRERHVQEAIRAAITLGRLAEVADIVPSYVFLASDDAGFITGQVLRVDGGQLIG